MDGKQESKCQWIFTEAVLLDENSEIPSTENPNDGHNTETVFYTVQKGDTLGKIATQYGTTIQEIAQINGIENIQNIMSLLINTNPYRKTYIDRFSNRVYSQEELWKFGISGDFPILLLKIIFLF